MNRGTLLSGRGEELAIHLYMYVHVYTSLSGLCISSVMLYLKMLGNVQVHNIHIHVHVLCVDVGTYL